MRQEDFEKFVMQNRKKYDAFNLSAAFTGCVCEFPQVSMTKMILRIKLPLTMLKAIANALLHNLSTLGISLRSMTDLLEQKPSL